VDRVRVKLRALTSIVLCLGLQLLCMPGLVSAQTDGLPERVQILPDEDAGATLCGDVEVTWNIVRSVDFLSPGLGTLTATASDGTPIFDLAQALNPGEDVIPLWCGDLLGDGSQALGYETFSGGLHCCFSATVLRLTPGAPHLLDVDLGNGGLVLPAQLDGSGALELPATSDVFAFFDDLSFAASPFMPLVFAFDGSAYLEATRQFPDRIRAEVAQTEAELTDLLRRGEPPELAFEGQKGLALRLYGLHVLLGDAARALPAIQARVPPPVAEWLAANAQAARDALAQVYALPGAAVDLQLRETQSAIASETPR
jgi:hypothetical protein